jgi:hypothetical protein
MESKKFPLWLALVIYVALCVLTFVVVVGYFTPTPATKDYDAYENYHKVTLYRSGNGLWSPTRRN